VPRSNKGSKAAAASIAGHAQAETPRQQEQEEVAEADASQPLL